MISGMIMVFVAIWIYQTAVKAKIDNVILWVAGGSGTNRLAYSYDGITWIGGPISPSITIGYSIAWNGIRFVAGGQSNVPNVNQVFIYSTNGISWLPCVNNTTMTICRSISWNGYRLNNTLPRCGCWM